MEYFLGLLAEGKLEKAAKYLSGFITHPANIDATPISSLDTVQQVSLKIFHDLHLQRYLEAIHHNDKYKAFFILNADLKYMLVAANFTHYTHLVELLTKETLP
jgi:hypothetical protein